jgi:hypothetical protein
MFGREKHSRESYEEAEKAVKIHDTNYKEAGTPIPSRGYNPDYEGMLANICEAEKRLEKLKSQGQKEAQELNERYDELRVRAAQAALALFDFEREKLGMHESSR